MTHSSVQYAAQDSRRVIEGVVERVDIRAATTAVPHNRFNKSRADD